MKRKITAARRKQLIEQLKRARAARVAMLGKKPAKKSRKKATKKRVSKKVAVRRTRSGNPIRHMPLYIIVARKGVGPKMHFDGVNFTTNGKPAFFEQHQLRGIAEGLVKKYPSVLKGYKLTGVPIKGTVSGKV
jgi:hypothetical protein